MEQKTYFAAKAIKIPARLRAKYNDARLIMPGLKVNVEDFKDDLERFVRDGVLVSPDLAMDIEKSDHVLINRAGPKPAPAVTKGKWAVDPAKLEDKELEDLLMMIVEIDPTVNIEGLDAEAARKFLSREFRPEFAEPKGEASGTTLERLAQSNQ